MNERSEQLVELLQERIAVLDGSTGVFLQTQGLTAADFGGPDLEGCNEALVLHRPDVVRAVHDAYLAAGAHIVETDTFGGTPLVLAEYGLARAHRRDQPRRRAQSPGRPAPRGPPPRGRASWRAPWAPRRRPSPSPAAPPSRR